MKIDESIIFLKLFRWNYKQLCFFDELTINKRTNNKKYAWTFVKSFCYNVQSFKKSKKWSILLVFTIDDYITHRVHYDNIIVDIFNDFVRFEIFFQYFFDNINVFVLNNARVTISSFELWLLDIEFLFRVDVIINRIFDMNFERDCDFNFQASHIKNQLS